MKGIFIFFLSCLSWFAFSQSYTVETVPNTKLINNSYVSNPDGLLQESTVNQINHQLKALEDSSTAQIAVVMLNSIGNADNVDFAQQLFKHWGIGQADKDNGLLILYVQDQRTIRFHTGYGLEGVLPDAICKHIQIRQMVPLFKAGDTDGGILAGIAEVNKILTNPAYAAEIKSELNEEEESSKTDWMYALSMMGSFVWFFVGLWRFFVQRKDGFSDSKNVKKGAPNTFMSSAQWLVFCFYLSIGSALGPRVLGGGLGLLGWALRLFSFYTNVQVHAHSEAGNRMDWARQISGG